MTSYRKSASVKKGRGFPGEIAGRVREAYHRGESGVLEIALSEGPRYLYFRQGELHLPGAHPLARRVAPLLADESAEGRQELQQMMSRIAAAVAGWEGGEMKFYEDGEALPDDLVGPLPTPLLVMNLATVERHDSELLAHLGGEEARLELSRFDPERARWRFFDQEDLHLLGELQGSAVLRGLLVRAGAGRQGELLRRLARLAAMGWVEPVSRGPSEEQESFRQLVRRFEERVGRRLHDQPLDPDPRKHREWIAGLLGRLGELDHYELLGVEATAGLERIHDAFDEVARQVHPAHASTVGLEGREGVLEVLFERATEAYLTLSDPRRRGAYDREIGVVQQPTVPAEEEREREKQGMARSYYERAGQLVDTEDFHFAVQLLREAIRYDPRPEYYVLMGEALANNPNWRDEAVSTLEEAVRMAPAETRSRLTLAQTLERHGRLEEARERFQEVLERVPGESEAEAGLARIERELAPPKKPSLLHRLFGGGGEE